MKIDLNGKTILELSELQLMMLENDIYQEFVEGEIAATIIAFVGQKIELSFLRMCQEWKHIIPENAHLMTREKLCLAIFTHRDYLSKNQRQKIKDMKDNEKFEVI